MWGNKNKLRIQREAQKAIILQQLAIHRQKIISKKRNDIDLYRNNILVNQLNGLIVELSNEKDIESGNGHDIDSDNGYDIESDNGYDIESVEEENIKLKVVEERKEPNIDLEYIYGVKDEIIDEIVNEISRK